MPEPSRCKPDADHKNQVIWAWFFNDKEYFIDGQDEIRFRVQNVKFPEIPKEQIGTKPFAPMEITVGFQMIHRISQEEKTVMNTIQSKALVGTVSRDGRRLKAINVPRAKDDKNQSFLYAQLEAVADMKFTDEFISLFMYPRSQYY